MSKANVKKYLRENSALRPDPYGDGHKFAVKVFDGEKGLVLKAVIWGRSEADVFSDITPQLSGFMELDVTPVTSNGGGQHTPVEYFDALKCETSQYSKRKFGEDVDQDTVIIASTKLDGRHVVKSITANTVSGQRFTVTPEDLFRAEFESGGKITESDNFKKWFGDSKIVGENGEPLVVYQEQQMARGGQVSQDRYGNAIGDGGFHSDYFVYDFSDYPFISSSVNKSATTESVYVTYYNSNNGEKVTVRFSNHENNAVKFGDQLNGKTASENQILHRLGAIKAKFIPDTYLSIHKTMVKKKEMPLYEEAELTIQEMYDLGADADISEYKGKLAKGSNWLILGDTVHMEESKKLDSFGQEVRVGKYEYEKMADGGEVIMVDVDGKKGNQWARLNAKPMPFQVAQEWVDSQGFLTKEGYSDVSYQMTIESDYGYEDGGMITYYQPMEYGLPIPEIPPMVTVLGRGGKVTNNSFLKSINNLRSKIKAELSKLAT